MNAMRYPGFRLMLCLVAFISLMDRGTLAGTQSKINAGGVDPLVSPIDSQYSDISNTSDSATLRIGVLDQSRSGNFAKSGNWNFGTGSVYSGARAFLQNTAYFGPSGTVKRPVVINSYSAITEDTLGAMDVFILVYTNDLVTQEVALLDKFVRNGGSLLVFSNCPPGSLGSVWAGGMYSERYGKITTQGYASPLISGPFGTVNTLYLGANCSATNVGQGVVISNNTIGPNMLMFRPENGFSGLGRAVIIGDDEIFMSGSAYGEYAGQMGFTDNQTFFLNIMAFLAGAPGYQPDVPELRIGVLDSSRCGNFTASGNWNFGAGAVYSGARAFLHNTAYFGPGGTVKRSVVINSYPAITEDTLKAMDVFILVYTNDPVSEEVALLDKFVRKGGALLIFSNCPPGSLGSVWAGGMYSERYGQITTQGYASPLISGPFGGVNTLYLGANCSATNIGQGVVISNNTIGPNMLMFRPEDGLAGLGRAVVIGDDEIFMSGSAYGEYAGQMGFTDNQTFFLNIMAFLAGAPGYRSESLIPRVAQISTNTITWEWDDNITDATGFKIWADAGTTTPTTPRTTTTADVTSWTMNDLLPNSPYSFRMAATLASGGESSATVPMTARTAIEPVALLVFSNIGTNRIDIAASSPFFSNLMDGKSGLLLTDKTLGTQSGWRQTTEAWAPATLLTPNTPYTFTGKSRNADGIETAPNEAQKFTLAGPPSQGNNVICDRQILKGFPVGTAFKFSNPLGFGAGTHGGSIYKVSGFRHAWNTAATYAFTGAEPLWNEGTLIRNTEAAGPYYLHLQSLNGEGVANPATLDIGPYNNTPPNTPAVSVNPASPGTLDNVAAVVASTDPDPGDTISGYRYEWSLGGAIKSTSTTLSADLTTRGQLWKLRSWAQDSYGAWSEPGQTTFTIVNTSPSQPIVEIKPKPIQAGHDMIVDILVYSTDPDGDTVAYDFKWFKSTDGGKTWIPKIELDGLPQVSGSYINEGELWEVHYVPYEKVFAKPSTGKPLGRIEGQYGWDRVYIGTDNPPKLTLEAPLLQRQNAGTLLSIGWDFSDADKDFCTVDLYWMTQSHPSDQLLAQGISARQGTWRVVGSIPLDKTLTVHGVIHDLKGTVVQKLSPAAIILPPASALIINYLLGRNSDPSGLDVDGNSKINVADLIGGVTATPPDVPATPSPADGAAAIPATPALNWADSLHAKSYHLYLWNANVARPASPTVTGLAVSNYEWKSALTKNTSYYWQVVAVNGTIKTTGPVWNFTTKP